MRTSVILSIIFHAVLFAAISVNFASNRTLEVDQPPPVPVEFVTPAEFSELKAGKRDGKAEAPAPPKVEEKPSETAPKPVEAPKPAEKPAKTQAAAAPPPPKPEPAPEPEKKPEPKPEEKPKPAEAPKPPEKPPEKKPEPPKPKKAEPKPEPKPKPETPRQQAKPRQDFDPDRIAALLNKDPNAGNVPPAPADKPLGRPPSSFEEQAAGLSQGTGQRMSLTEIDLFRRQISQCWAPPVGGLGGQSMVVRLRIEMKPDGTIARPPQVLNSAGSSFFQAAADSAVRAVLQCQPYKMPAEKYDQWRDMILNFDPSQM